MYETVEHTAPQLPPLGVESAAALRRDTGNREAAQRLVPEGGRSRGLDRLVALTARLLAAPSVQISLLTGVQVIPAGVGLLPGEVGGASPLEASLCSVTATQQAPLVIADARGEDRFRDFPPVRSGQVGAYLGVPLRTDHGEVVGALCVVDVAARSWSATDVATLEQLGEAVVTELELTTLLRQYEDDRLRWGLAIDAAGIGTFDWDLTSGRLVWDEQLIEMFGYDVTDFDESIESFNARLHSDDLPRVTEALQACIATCGDYEAEYRVIRPDGDVRWVHARGRALAGADGTAVRVLGAAYDTTGERNGAVRVARVLEAMPAGFYSLDREWR